MAYKCLPEAEPKKNRFSYDGWLDGMDGQMDTWVDGCTDGWMDRRMNAWGLQGTDAALPTGTGGLLCGRLAFGFCMHSLQGDDLWPRQGCLCPFSIPQSPQLQLRFPWQQPEPLTAEVGAPEPRGQRGMRQKER